EYGRRAITGRFDRHPTDVRQERRLIRRLEDRLLHLRIKAKRAVRPPQARLALEQLRDGAAPGLTDPQRLKEERGEDRGEEAACEKIGRDEGSKRRPTRARRGGELPVPGGELDVEDDRRCVEDLGVADEDAAAFSETVDPTKRDRKLIAGGA